MKNRIISLLLSMVLVVTCFAPNVFAAEETGVEGFVERLYTIALNRASEPDGKAFWVKQLKDKTMTGAEVAHGFFFSKEFTDADLSNGEYVTRLYKTFMDREPENEGFDFWTTGLFSGTLTRESTFQGFIESDEWDSICKNFGIVPGSRREVKYFVYHLYSTALDRFGEEDGVNYWTDQLYQKKMSGIDVAFAFYNSPEYLQLEIDDERFIRLTYALFFDNREADEDGFNFWLDKLRTGTSRAELFYGFAYSEEYAQTCLRYGIKADFNAQPKPSENTSTPTPTQAPVKETWNQADIEKAAKEQGLVWYDIECVGYKDASGNFVFDISKNVPSGQRIYNEKTGKWEDEMILAPDACFGTIRVYGKFLDPSLEAQYVNIVNDYRNSLGVPSLKTVDAEKTEYCKLRSAELAVYFKHIRPNGFDMGVGENIAAGYAIEGAENQLPEEIFKLYKESEGHRIAMIQSDYIYGCSSTFINYEWNGTSFERGSCYNSTCFWTNAN